MMSKEKRTGLEIHFKDGTNEYFDLDETATMLMQENIFEKWKNNTVLQNRDGQYVQFRNSTVERIKTIGL